MQAREDLEARPLQVNREGEEKGCAGDGLLSLLGMWLPVAAALGEQHQQVQLYEPHIAPLVVHQTFTFACPSLHAVFAAAAVLLPCSLWS